MNSIAPKLLIGLPGELLYEVIHNIEVDDVILLVCSYMFSAQFCYLILKEKIKQCVKMWTPVQKSGFPSTEMISNMLYIIHFMVMKSMIELETATDFDDGFCYLRGLREVSWATTAFHVIGSFPTPWLVDCLYKASSGFVKLPDCGRRQRSLCVRKVGSGYVYQCRRCEIEMMSWAQTMRDAHVNVEQERSKILLKEIVEESQYHFCGFHGTKTISTNQSVMLTAEYGDCQMYTLFLLRQKDCFFTAKVGAPEVVNFDLESTLSTNKSEGVNHKNGNGEFDTLHPMDSASNITPRPLGHNKPRLSIDNDLNDRISQIMASQLQTLRADLQSGLSNVTSRIGDYTRNEYDQDLEEAFQSCGVVVKDGEMYLKPVAHTRASELIPRVTIDDRLNFLIRLHTAIFKVVRNTADYPRPGIMNDLRRVFEGKMFNDHPSFDLLQIVVTDTFDWAHSIIKTNNFLLPVIEPNMRFNERILASCLLSLKTEYFTRWTSVMKDCILPNDITDTSRWSDSFESEASNRITSRRPDMALQSRDNTRRSYHKKRRDSLFG
jgi:hypothetical protein